jgi:hypothetical protein
MRLRTRVGQGRIGLHGDSALLEQLGHLLAGIARTGSPGRAHAVILLDTSALVSADSAFAHVGDLPHVVPDEAGVERLLKAE